MPKIVSDLRVRLIKLSVQIITQNFIALFKKSSSSSVKVMFNSKKWEEKLSKLGLLYWYENVSLSSLVPLLKGLTEQVLIHLTNLYEWQSREDNWGSVVT